MKQLIGSAVFICLITVSFTAGTVFAQSPTPRAAKIRSEVQERKQELREDMCQRVTDRIGERRQRFEEHRDNRVNIYRGIIERLKNLVTKLKDRGCDASQVETDLTTLEKLVDELVVAFNLFVDKLQAVRIPVCQEEPGDWKTAMAQVREQLQLVKAKHQEVRAFYKDTLKPDVKVASQTCRATNE